MRRVAPENPAYYQLLQKFTAVKSEKRCRLVHQQMISSGLGSNIALCTKLIAVYSKLGHIGNAHKVFDKMPERDIVSWTALLSGYSQNGYFEQSLLVFRQFLCSGLKGNQFIYASALKACAQLPCLKLGRQIQGCVNKSGFGSNEFVLTALAGLYSKCGYLEEASQIFESMSCRDLVSWNSMIGDLAARGMVADSFSKFRLMLREGIYPDSSTFVSLLGVCAISKRHSKLSEVHGFIIQLGFGSHGRIGGLLIDAYAKCGDIDRASRVFKFIPSKDVFSCTNMITAYSRDGSHSSDSLGLFCEIFQLGIEMDDVLLCSVLNVCAGTASLSLGRQIHAIVVKSYPGFDVAMGNALVSMYGDCGELEDSNLMFTELEKKNVISWSSLIGAYAKHGYGHKAISLFREMESQGFKPNEVTFLSLLFGCCQNGLTSEGWDCFKIMIDEYGIVPTEKHYSCMVDLLARGGKLEEAFFLIEKMNIRPNADLWSLLLGACNSHGNVALAEIAAGKLINLDPNNSASYVAVANLYSGVGLWDKAQSMRVLMEQKSLQKHQGFSYFPSME